MPNLTASADVDAMLSAADYAAIRTLLGLIGTISGGGTISLGGFTLTVPATGTALLSSGALGTPSSGTVTNLTGTASINVNGTVGATTPAAGSFTTLAASTSATTPLVIGGTGAASSLTLESTSGTGTSDSIIFKTGSQSTRWTMNTSGHLLAGADNVHDIGASGATRPRNIWVAGTVSAGVVSVGGGSIIVGNLNNTNNTINMLVFGSDANATFSSGSATPLFRFAGTTSSFPALKRNGTALDIVLADGTNGGGLNVTGALSVTLTTAFGARADFKSYTVATLPAAGAAAGVVFVSDAGGNGPCLAISNGTNWKRCDNTSTTVS